MVLHTSILNHSNHTPLSEKINIEVSLPKHEVLHSDNLKILKEKAKVCKITNEVFVLTEKYLYCAAGDLTTDGSQIAFTAKIRIKLRWVICNFEVKEYSRGKKYCVEFIKNNKKIVCDALNESRFNKWKEVLKPRVVHLNFHSKYRVDESISARNKGGLVKMIHNETGEIYFTEKISKISLKEEAAIVKLTHQIKILRKLNDFCGVLQFKELHETAESLYIVYEPYFGAPVFHHNFKYTTGAFLNILKSVLSILRALEVKGVTHNYIRPKNVCYRYSNKSIEHNEIVLTNLSKARRACQQSSEDSEMLVTGDVAVDCGEGRAHNQDIVDLGRTCLNYFYYAQYNKFLDNSTDFASIINSPSFFMSSSRKLSSQGSALQNGEHRTGCLSLHFEVFKPRDL